MNSLAPDLPKLPLSIEHDEVYNFVYLKDADGRRVASLFGTLKQKKDMANFLVASTSSGSAQVVKGDTYPTPEHGWVCYHCGEHFPGDFAGSRRARDHFGWQPNATPVCLLAKEDRGLLRALRSAEHQRDGLQAQIASAVEAVDALKAHIIGDAIVIRLPVDNLPSGVDGAWAAGYLSPRLKVTDAASFAKALCHALNEESEDGTTQVHRLFDKAVLIAFEGGAEGIEEHDDQEGSVIPPLDEPQPAQDVNG